MINPPRRTATLCEKHCWVEDKCPVCLIQELDAKLAEYETLATTVAETKTEDLTYSFLGYVLRQLCEIRALRRLEEEK